MNIRPRSSVFIRGELSGLTPAMSSEDQLIPLLARGAVAGVARLEAERLLATPLDWDYIYTRAAEQGVLPLVYRNLRLMGFASVPETTVSKFAAAFRSNALRNVLLARELSRLLALLTDASIRAIPLKGVALAERLYGDVALRVSADLDLLVPRDRVLDAVNVLLGAGYSALLPLAHISSRLLDGAIELAFRRHEASFVYTVEFHWRLVHGEAQSSPATGDAWEEARLEGRLGGTIYALSREWEFLYLCLHAASHGWGSLKWLADINEICTSEHVDWEKVREKASRFGLVAPAEFGLTACHVLFGAVVPKQFSFRRLPTGVRLFPGAPSWFTPFVGVVMYFRLLPNAPERLRCLAELCFTPTTNEYDLLTLPVWLNGLYYLVRPIRLSCKWAWRSLEALVPRDWRLEPGLRAGQARSAFASAWQSLAVKVSDLAAYCPLRTAYWCPRGALLCLLIGLLCILSLRAASNTATVSLVVQVRPEARLDQDGFSFDWTIGLPAGAQVRL